MRQIPHIGHSVSLYCIQIQVPIKREGIPRIKVKNDQMQHCTSVTSVFKTSGRKGHFEFFLNHFCVYSSLVPINFLTLIFQKENSSQNISQKSKSNVTIIYQSHCITSQQLNNLVHREMGYNLSLLFLFGI